MWIDTRVRSLQWHSTFSPVHMHSLDQSKSRGSLLWKKYIKIYKIIFHFAPKPNEIEIWKWYFMSIIKQTLLFISFFFAYSRERAWIRNKLSEIGNEVARRWWSILIEISRAINLDWAITFDAESGSVHNKTKYNIPHDDL